MCCMEFSTSAILALFGSKMTGSFSAGIFFAVIYALMQSQFKHRARGNPVLSFADYLVGEGGTPGECVGTIVMQCLGWTFGAWFGGIINQAPVDAGAAASDFSTVVVQEMVASGFFVWLWLSIHHSDTKDKWGDFMGLAVGIAIYVALSVKAEGVSGNPAQFFGAGERFKVFTDGDTMWLITFFAPIFAAFVSTLVF